MRICRCESDVTKEIDATTLISINEALTPFVAVLEAYENSDLQRVRPEWSDIEGDQDHITLLESRSGVALLALKHFLDLRKIQKLINPSSPIKG